MTKKQPAFCQVAWKSHFMCSIELYFHQTVEQLSCQGSPETSHEKKKIYNRKSKHLLVKLIFGEVYTKCTDSFEGPAFSSNTLQKTL